MANTKSAQKQARVALRRRARNVQTIKAVKTTEKKIRALIKTGNKDEAARMLPKFQAVVDRAAKKGVVKKNYASRHKSRVTKALAK
jgi:small subunit ribosomal protein S20